MRYFPVILDTLDEEKIFGGVISIRQAVYLLFAVITGILTFFLPVHLLFKIPLSVLLVACGLCLAFGRIKDTNADKIIYYAARYLVKNKKYILRGED